MYVFFTMMVFVNLRLYWQPQYFLRKICAAICGGAELLAAYGVLDNKRCTGDSDGIKLDGDYIELFRKSIIRKDDVVVDGNIITSTGQAFVEFAFKLGTIMDIFKDKDAAQKAYKWYKNIKD